MLFYDRLHDSCDSLNNSLPAVIRRAGHRAHAVLVAVHVHLTVLSLAVGEVEPEVLGVVGEVPGGTGLDVGVGLPSLAPL